MWAIEKKGIGEEVGARRIGKGWPLAEGEAFTVDHWEPGMRLAEDGTSLRAETTEERQAREAGPAAEAGGITADALAALLVDKGVIAPADLAAKRFGLESEKAK
jgi:hypothetical protein